MAWILVKEGEAHSAMAGHREWQLDSTSDIGNPPAEAVSASPGSKAWTGDYAHIYNKTNDGEWEDILANE